MVQTPRVRRSCGCNPRPSRESPNRAAKRSHPPAINGASVWRTPETLRRTEIRAALASAESMFRLCAYQLPNPALDRFEHAAHVDVHADPLRTRATMTINAAINVRAFDADVCCI